MLDTDIYHRQVFGWESTGTEQVKFRDHFLQWLSVLFLYYLFTCFFCGFHNCHQNTTNSERSAMEPPVLLLYTGDHQMSEEKPHSDTIEMCSVHLKSEPTQNPKRIPFEYEV